MNAPESSHTHFVVLSFERQEGERFAIFRHGDWLLAASPSQWRSPMTFAEQMDRFVKSLELLTEDSLRTRLQGMGCGEDTLTGHIVRARNIRQMSKGGSWEHVTMLGYRNDDGQVVVAKTARSDTSLEQRVFVIRCSVCGHEYGTYGSEIPHRCCPNCQDGPPGLPV